MERHGPSSVDKTITEKPTCTHENVGHQGRKTLDTRKLQLPRASCTSPSHRHPRGIPQESIVMNSPANAGHGAEHQFTRSVGHLHNIFVAVSLWPSNNRRCRRSGLTRTCSSLKRSVAIQAFTSPSPSEAYARLRFFRQNASVIVSPFPLYRRGLLLLFFIVGRGKPALSLKRIGEVR